MLAQVKKKQHQFTWHVWRRIWSPDTDQLNVGTRERGKSRMGPKFLPRYLGSSVQQHVPACNIQCLKVAAVQLLATTGRQGM